jgi:hypothetical protein
MSGKSDFVYTFLDFSETHYHTLKTDMIIINNIKFATYGKKELYLYLA